MGSPELIEELTDILHHLLGASPVTLAGHVLQRFYALDGGVHVRPPRRGAGYGGERVVNIVAAQQVQLHRQGLGPGLQYETGHVLEHFDFVRPEIRLFFDTERQRPCFPFQDFHKRRGAFVVGIDHGALVFFRGALQQLKDVRLGLEIAFPVLVEIQVVPLQVGERGHVEFHVLHAAQRQRVRGNLHYGRQRVRGGHFRQQLLQVVRERRGVGGLGDYAAVHAVVYGAYHAGAHAAEAQHVLQQVCRSGLALGTGYAENLQVP